MIVACQLRVTNPKDREALCRQLKPYATTVQIIHDVVYCNYSGLGRSNGQKMVAIMDKFEQKNADEEDG